MKIEQLLETVGILNIPGITVTVIDPEFNILCANATAKKIFGQLHEQGYQFEGKKCYEAYKNNQNPCTGCPTARIVTERKPFDETFEAYNSLVKKHFVVNAMPVHDNDKLVGVLEVAHDVSEIVQSKLVLVKADKLLAVGAYAVGLAHDLNNLLTQILGPIGLSKEYIKDKKISGALEQLKLAEEGVMKSSGLMQNLLGYTREEKNTRESVHLDSLLQKSIDFFTKRCRQQKIELAAELQSVPPFEGYSGNIERVCMNLMVNAIEAFENYNAEKKKITVRCYHEDGFVCGEFEDNGPGIDLINQLKIFDFCFTTKKHGYGIGLAASRAIIENHHYGKISCESEPGKGAKFIFKIPDATALKIMRQDTWFGKRSD